MGKNKHEKIRNIINRWLWDNVSTTSGYLFAVGFEVKLTTIYIYTDKPGFLIGLAGSVVNDLKSKLSEAGIHKKIQFVELGTNTSVREIRRF